MARATGEGDGDGGGLSRRELLGAAGLGVAGLGLGAGGLRAIEGALAASERRNVVLIVIDSLRADHVRSFGARDMRTPSIDELARGGVRFTRVFPEAMPTVPARRSLMSGRHTYPFRGWRPWDGMAGRPGWQPIKPGAETLITALRRAGWWTSYVTDNPFLGYTKTFESFRRSPHRFVRIEGQRGARRPRTLVPRDAAGDRSQYGAGGQCQRSRQSVASSRGGGWSRARAGRGALANDVHRLRRALRAD